MHLVVYKDILLVNAKLHEVFEILFLVVGLAEGNEGPFFDKMFHKMILFF